MQSRRDALKTILLAGATMPALLHALSAAAEEVISLKDAYKDDFLIGAAMNAAQIAGRDVRGDRHH